MTLATDSDPILTTPQRRTSTGPQASARTKFTPRCSQPNARCGYRALLTTVSLAMLNLAVVGCQGGGLAPPFEWWADPLPAPPKAPTPEAMAHVVVLVEHTGRRDDFKAFSKELHRLDRRVQKGEIPGFRLACHYLPDLAEAVREDIEQGLARTGWFDPVKDRTTNRALRELGLHWAELTHPSNAAALGRACEANLVLLVEIKGCTMRVIEARRQTVGAKKVGPTRQTQVTLDYALRAVDVDRAAMVWSATLTRRAEYKLEGPGALGHWYRRRDPLEFRQALRGRGVTEFIIRAFLGNGEASEPAQRSPSDFRRFERRATDR